MSDGARNSRRVAAVLLACVMVAACAAPVPKGGAGATPGSSGGAAASTSAAAAAPATAPAAAAKPAAYLPAGAEVASLAFLPPPPSPGTPAFAHDEDVARQALALRDSARWRLATEDANIEFPRVASTYACALGTAISPEATPVLYRLIQRVAQDSARTTRSAKDTYRRARPFTVNGEPTCDPQREAELRTDGSYPSGHAARGWLWALIVAEVAPDRTPQLLARGRAYGESRVVCNYHWRSDILASRDLAAATFVRLHESAEFRADVEAARAEVAAARASGVAPNRDCAAEASALAEFGPIGH